MQSFGSLINPSFSHFSVFPEPDAVGDVVVDEPVVVGEVVDSPEPDVVPGDLVGVSVVVEEPVVCGSFVVGSFVADPSVDVDSPGCLDASVVAGSGVVVRPSEGTVVTGEPSPDLSVVVDGF